MMLCLGGVFDQAEAAALRSEVEHLRFADGRATAGWAARLVKNNEQADADDDLAAPREEEWWLDSVLGLRLELERPNSSPKPSHADSLTLKSAARVAVGRSVNDELTENESCAFIGGGYAVNRTREVRNNG
jgi:hypothetical protein